MKALERILHVDDEPDLRDIVALTLSALGGYETQSCASGVDALEMARAFLPDLIILDVMMPVMDGPATLQALREDATLGHVPVVFMTAKGMPQEIERLRGLGALDVIQKPFEPSELPRQIAQLWQEHQAQPVIASPALSPEALPMEEMAHFRQRYITRARQTRQSLEELGRQAFSRSAASETDPCVIEIRALAHKLAGNSAQFGFADVGKLAAEVERVIETGNMLALPVMLAALVAQLQDVERDDADAEGAVGMPTRGIAPQPDLPLSQCQLPSTR